jgi:hypothetical protein
MSATRWPAAVDQVASFVATTVHDEINGGIRFGTESG